MISPTQGLPVERRAEQGGWLFLASLAMFFLGSILLYLLYAFWRRDETESTAPLPDGFLASTFLLLLISGLLHGAFYWVRRDKFGVASACLWGSLFASFGFIAIQSVSLWEILSNVSFTAAPHRGVIAMVMVLAILHALHVVGGVIALGIVSVRNHRGYYDHERNWGVRFVAQYWHFLDAIWLCMLGAFWATSGGFHF